MRRTACLLIAAVLAGSACRTADGRAQPAPSVESATPTPAVTYEPEPCKGRVRADVLFDVRQDVSREFVAFVREAINQARRYFRFRPPDCESFGTSVEITDEARGPWAATVYAGNIYIRGGDAVWLYAPVEGRYTLLFHEWYHLVQEELLQLEDPGIPDWLAEGSAEWVGHRAAVHYGYYPSNAYVRAIQREEALRAEMPLERLASGVPIGPPYALSYMAVDELDVREATLLRFWRDVGAGKPWRKVFRDLFGQTVQRFYRRFEAARRARFPS